jgi:predicted ATPase
MGLGLDGFVLEMAEEAIEDESPDGPGPAPIHYINLRGSSPRLYDQAYNVRDFRRNEISQDRSILSQIRDPNLYPAVTRLQDAYGSIRMFRNWSFGPSAELRRDQSTLDPGEFLREGGENLALVLLNTIWRIGDDLEYSLRKAYEGLESVGVQVSRGNVFLYVEESGGRRIPSTRLSDGTLRYLCLLVILLHPQPPPLTVIEEPELGLHPDLIHHLADLLEKAATRTQLVVTTHSRLLVDEMTDQPESVVVCEKHDGESSFERLDADRMKHWLDRYSLGQLWSSGELGGNRW